MWTCAAVGHLLCPGPVLMGHTASVAPGSAQPATCPGEDATTIPNPATPQFARAGLILRAALIEQSGSSALSGALGDGEGTPPQAFILSPELDSILHMYEYMERACSAHLRVHLTPLPYVPPLEPLSKLIDLPLPCTRPPGHTTKHPPCRSFATVDAPSCLPGATPPFRCVPQLWFVPTLLRISRFQHHPWVWYAGRRSRRVRVARDTLSCRSHRACIQSCRVLQTCPSALGPYHLWSALIAGLWPGLHTSTWSEPHWIHQILQLAHAGISLTLFRTHTAVMHRTSRHTTHAQPSQAPPSFTCGPPGPKSGKHSGSQPFASPGVPEY